MSALGNPFPLFNDTNNRLLSNGQIFIGEAGEDPEAFPLPVYWDAAFTVSAAQPLETTNGVVVRDGSPANAYVDADTFSYRARQQNGEIVFDLPNFSPHGGGSGNIDTSLGVWLHTYPGTTVLEDPHRLDNDNKRFENASADTTNPISANFGKIIYGAPGAGSATLAHLGDFIDGGTGELVPERYRPRAGFFMIDCWSQNGEVPDDYPASPIVKFGELPGNLKSGVRFHLLPGAGVMRPPRPDFNSVLRPLILCCDPNNTPETTDPDTGIDTQEDVYKNIEIICHGDSGFYGENYRWGFRPHHNDISLNAASDFYVQTNHYATLCDPLYIGARNIGGGLFNAHNKRGEVHVVADGYNQNNRNVVSVIDCVGLRGTVRGYNFSREGGPGTDPYFPTSGDLAPGIVDVEPNAFTDDPRIDDIELDVYGEDGGAACVATLLIDNDVIPVPLGSMRFTGRAVRCRHGKHSMIGAGDMAVPYRIHVRMDALDCRVPFEVLSGQGCTHEGGFNLKSFQSGLIGYTGFAAPQDFWRINEIDQELGSGDSGAVQVRGWNGGGISGGQMINGNGIAYHLLSNPASAGASPIRDLILGPYSFVNRDNITSQSMTHAWYVDPSDGGPQLFASTITERDIAYNGLINNLWAVSGSFVKSIPGTGLWELGKEVYGDPSLEPGSPRVMRTRKTNVSGEPSFFIQEQIGGFTPDSGGVNDIAGWVRTRMNAAAGRFTAIDPLAVARSTTSSNSPTALIGKTPFSGSSTVYVGFTQSANPTSVADIVIGVWFGDTTGLANKGVPILSGTVGGTPFSYKYGDGFTISALAGNSSTVSYTPAGGSPVTVASSGIPAGALYACVIINVAGETIFLTGAPA